MPTLWSAPACAEVYACVRWHLFHVHKTFPDTRYITRLVTIYIEYIATNSNLVIKVKSLTFCSCLSCCRWTCLKRVSRGFVQLHGGALLGQLYFHLGALYKKRKPCGTPPENTWNYSFKTNKKTYKWHHLCSLVKNMVSCRFSRNPLIGVGFSMMVEVEGISVRGCCWSTPVYPVCKFHQTAVHECWDVSIFERLKTYPCVCVWSTITSPNLQVGWHICHPYHHNYYVSLWIQVPS